MKMCQVYFPVPFVPAIFWSYHNYYQICDYLLSNDKHYGLWITTEKPLFLYYACISNCWQMCLLLNTLGNTKQCLCSWTESTQIERFCVFATVQMVRPIWICGIKCTYYFNFENICKPLELKRPISHGFRTARYPIANPSIRKVGSV